MSRVDELIGFFQTVDSKVREIILKLLNSNKPEDIIKAVEIFHKHYGYDEETIKEAVRLAMQRLWEEAATEEEDVIGMNLESEAE